MCDTLSRWAATLVNKGKSDSFQVRDENLLRAYIDFAQFLKYIALNGSFSWEPLSLCGIGKGFLYFGQMTASISSSATPIVEGYLMADTYHGNVSDPGVDPEDFSPLQTPNGIRIYFALYDKGKVIPESGIYSVINTSIR
jgi:hypothetical protein